MTDSKAEIIADSYEVNLETAKRIGVKKDNAPFVAVCLTILDLKEQRESDMLYTSLANKMHKLRRLVEENL